MDAPSEPAAQSEPATPIVLEPRQRWRLTVARAAGAPALTQRELADAWTVAIDAAGLPIAGASKRGRSGIVFGAPLAMSMPAEGERMELVLADRWPRWRVREALAPRLPTGWSLTDLEDVWLGAPSLPATVAAADYRVTLAEPVDPNLLELAVGALLAADELRRPKPKGDGAATYDLRVLVLGLALRLGHGPAIMLRVRARLDQTLGSGRPEEVVAALGEILRSPLTIATVVRERVLVAEELGG